MSAPVGKAGIARSTAWSVANQVAGLLLPLALTPYIVAKVGLDRYGFWVVLNAATIWLSQYDLGLGGAITREAARRRAQDDLPGMARLWSAWLRYDIVCIVILGAVAGGAGAAFLPGEGLLVVLLSLQALLVPLFRHLHATLAGVQRLGAASRMGVLVLPLSAAGTVAVLQGGFGLPGMAANGLAWLGLQVAGLWVLLRSGGHPGPAGGGREDFAALRSFGMRAYAGQVVTQAFRSDRLFLALGGMPTASIASYQFGAGMSERLGALVTGLSAALPAAVSDLHARGDSVRIKAVLLRGARLHGLAATFLLGFAAAFAPELLQFWLGTVPPGAALVLRLSAVGAWAASAASPAHATAYAMGLPGCSTLAQSGGLGAAVVLYMAWGRRYDGPGLAASLAFGWAVGQALLVGAMRRRVEYSWGDFAGNALLKPAVVLVPIGLAWAAWRYGMGGVLGPGRWEAWTVLAPAFGGAALLAWPAARLTGAIERDDVGLLRSLGRRDTA